MGNKAGRERAQDNVRNGRQRGRVEELEKSGAVEELAHMDAWQGPDVLSVNS